MHLMAWIEVLTCLREMVQFERASETATARKFEATSLRAAPRMFFLADLETPKFRKHAKNSTHWFSFSANKFQLYL
jgi:hypothetical protein